MEMNLAETKDFASLRDFLRRHLLENVMPFWTRHALDPAGGINTCIRDDGTLVSRDKWMWSQWRAVWVFSKFYSDLEPRREWLSAAEGIYRFARDHGWGSKGKGCALVVSADGQVLRDHESLYVDAFAIYGLCAYARAAGSEEAADLARRSADYALDVLQRPHDRIPHWPYPVPPGARVHGLPMIFSLVLWEAGQFLDEDRYRQAALELSDEVFQRFYRPDRDLVLERIAADGGEYPPPLGTAVVPGHVVEDMWFQIHVAREAGGLDDRITEAAQLTVRHVELGWDDVFGGLLLAVDADGHDEVGWEFADTKLWWPHTEALYALLLAYEQDPRDEFLHWYDKVHEYSFAHYPVAGHGEWAQKLDRRGRPFQQTVALPVKDPFHLPRALFHCIKVLGRLAGGGGE